MGLIVCPECGNKVSDRASACLKCGYPVSEMLEKKAFEEQEICNQMELNKKRVLRKRIKYLIIILIVFVFGGAGVICFTKPDRSGLYNNISWDSTIAQIESKYPDGYRGSDNTKTDSSYSAIIHNYEQIEGTLALVRFCFHDDRLYEISAIVMTEDNGKSYYKLVQELKHHYKDLYGSPDESGSSLRWKKKKSTITFSDYDSMIIIEYEDVNHNK